MPDKPMKDLSLEINGFSEVSTIRQEYLVMINQSV